LVFVSCSRKAGGRKAIEEVPAGKQTPAKILLILHICCFKGNCEFWKLFVNLTWLKTNTCWNIVNYSLLLFLRYNGSRLMWNREKVITLSEWKQYKNIDDKIPYWEWFGIWQIWVNLITLTELPNYIKQLPLKLRV